MDFDAVMRRFTRCRVLVVGDLMLDQFIWGRVDRVSPEAPVPVVRVTSESFLLGGAGNVANNLRTLGANVSVCGILGRDPEGARVLALLGAAGAAIGGVVRSATTVTTRKTRVVAHSQQVVRFDREQAPPSTSVVTRLVDYLARHAGDFDAILVSDYGKGVVNARTLAALPSAGRRSRIIVDPKQPNFAAYGGITLATPNAQEASEASGIVIRSAADVEKAGRHLCRRWRAEALLITRGEHGMTLVEADGPVRPLPALSRQVYDVTGAGDTVAAVCAVALAGGASFEQAAILANHAAGIVVGKLGTATVQRRELRDALATRTTPMPARARRASAETR